MKEGINERRGGKPEHTPGGHPAVEKGVCGVEACLFCSFEVNKILHERYYRNLKDC